MNTLTITGVPEHFNYPWVELINQQPLTDHKTKLIWKEESRGSGKMLEALEFGETDLAIVLTESFFKKFESNPDIKILGLYVKSPLVWGIHVSAIGSGKKLTELSNPKFLISRKGSGSELMAHVLADRQKWNPEDLEFEIINNLPGALERMKTHQNEMFLWEKFTTKPHVDSGEMERIDEVASPWPCFVIIAKEATIQTHEVGLTRLMKAIYQMNSKVSQDPEASQKIAEKYQLPQVDVKEWMEQTEWQLGPLISSQTIQESVEKMIHFGILRKQIDFKQAFYPGFVELR